MKHSTSSHKDLVDQTQSQDELPKQWDYFSKRLQQVEKGLTILEKRYVKIQKKFNSHARQINQFNTELTEEILKLKTNSPTNLQIKQAILKQIECVESKIRKSCQEQTLHYLSNMNLSVNDKNQSLQIKIKSIYDQTKSYVDRAIFQLKEILKKYVKEQTDLQKKFERSSRQNSPSFMPKNSLNKSKSAKKFFQVPSKAESISDKYMQSSQDWLQKSRENLSKQSAASNRVSYLRQKLKQFEKINKKYEEAEADTNKGSKKQGKQEAMSRMRNYRHYLEQSESELQPSNILASQQLIGYSGLKKNNLPAF